MSAVEVRVELAVALIVEVARVVWVEAAEGVAGVGRVLEERPDHICLLDFELPLVVGVDQVRREVLQTCHVEGVRT